MKFDLPIGFTAETALLQVGAVLSIASIVHSLEFLFLRQTLGTKGIWQSRDLAAELPLGPRWQKRASFILDHRIFLIAQLVRMAAVALWFLAPGPLPLATMLFVHLLTLVRFRGSFNGGSDSLMFYFLMLAVVGQASLHKQPSTQGAIWGLAMLLVFSYFRAGLAKIRRKNWRTGVALREFLTSSKYQKLPVIDAMTQSQSFLRIASWGIILFELTFPLALGSPFLAFCYICTGLIFHLANGAIFGLNRFLYAWISGYPALLYCAS